MADMLLAHPAAARALVGLFRARFDPALERRGAGRPRTPRWPTARELIDAVTGLDADRILRGFLGMIGATLRTNFYRERPFLSFKIDPSAVPDMPAPRPRFEIFVYSPRVEGVHLRYGPVARGGLRWSDRPQDFRTEILGLVKAQAVKNAVIVPVGAKGGFVVRRPEAGSDEVVACYRTFISGLLDVTDNLVTRPDGRPRRCRRRTWCATTATTPTWSSPRTRAPPRSPTSPTRWPRPTGSGWATRSPPAGRWATTTRRWASPPAARGRA